MYKKVNGKLVELTAQEIDERKQEEIKWNDEVFLRELEAIRLKRNRLLEETDYLMLADYPLDDKSAYVSYRQALRDLPNNLSSAEDLVNLNWPLKP